MSRFITTLCISSLVEYNIRPTDFERNGSKVLGEVKKPAYQDESDWSILNWLNRDITVMCLQGSLERALECDGFINHNEINDNVVYC